LRKFETRGSHHRRPVAASLALLASSLQRPKPCLLKLAGQLAPSWSDALIVSQQASGPFTGTSAESASRRLADSAVSVDLGRGVDDAKRSHGILAKHQVAAHWRVQVKDARQVLSLVAIDQRNAVAAARAQLNEALGDVQVTCTPAEK